MRSLAVLKAHDLPLKQNIKATIKARAIILNNDKNSLQNQVMEF